MKKQKKIFTISNRSYALCGILFLLVAGILQAAARRLSGFGEWYATTLYPAIVGTIGRIWGIFPVSVVEISIYMLIIAMTVYIIHHIRHIGSILTRILFLLGLLALLFTLNCGINYYRRPFSSYLSLEIKKSSPEELQKLCAFLTERVNETVDESRYERSWNLDGQAAMMHLGETYPQLSGYYPVPKALLFSEILSVQQLCGVYSPFTVEANYNCDMPTYNIPHTICHELSHLKGFMREDEANFIGYLAAIGSDNPAFCYSGYLTGWIHATNALAKLDAKAYGDLYHQLDPRVILHLQQNSEFWNRYEGKVAEVSNQWNDAYLKMNDQADGVLSYGRMVDLMLAYYREEK
ncbi:MAG: DUF3810 domain-containing protein [Hungatella sp.]